MIKVRDGDPVFVRDVADVVFGFEDETSRSRVDREPSVTLSVEKRTGANLVGVADLVNAELGRWDEMLPEGINTAVVGGHLRRDQADGERAGETTSSPDCCWWSGA